MRHPENPYEELMTRSENVMSDHETGRRVGRRRVGKKKGRYEKHKNWLIVCTRNVQVSLKMIG